MNKRSQAPISCVVCRNKLKNKAFICSNCAKNPFKIELGRTLLAKKNDLSLFKKLYSENYAEINNINSQKFWDAKFSSDTSFSKQDPMTKDKINKISKYIPPSTKTLLDLGFGMGYLEETIAESSVNIFGIDISKDAVKRARKKFKGNFIQGDISKIKFIYNISRFDVVVALEIIEHVSPSQIFKFFKNAKSLLKKNGIFIISTPLNEHLEKKKDNPSGHVREYTIPILKAELETSGFKVVKVKMFYAFGKYYFLKKILAGFLPWLWEANNVVIVARKVIT